jgi:hypothetical protein
MIHKETLQAFINATKLRAKAYAYFFEELKKEFGREKALELGSKVAYRLGLDKAGGFPPGTGGLVSKTAQSFAGDPVGNAVFQLEVLSDNEDEAIIEMSHCPLVEMWVSMGYSRDTIEDLCEFAHKIDYGTIEGAGCKLEFNSRISRGSKSCVLRIFL